MNWLRLYTTVLDNPKLQRLPNDKFKALVNLWCLASIHNGTLPPVSDIAFRLRFTDEQAAALISYLIDKELIDETPDGLVPHDWTEHQYASDNSTVRVQNWRKRNKEQGETSPQRFSNGAEQNRTETDTEQSRTDTPSVRAALPNLRKATADDLSGPVSMHFEEWFQIWAAARGNAYRSNACSQYLSVVMAERENDVMECTRSYVAGPGADPAHGYRPDRFLAEMARDSFKTRWPAQRAGPQRQETPTQAAIRKAKEAQNGTR